MSLPYAEMEMTKRREIMRIADGHLNSHRVYGNPYGCRQHFEGQLPGQQQQQHRNGHAKRNTKNGTRKGPINNARLTIFELSIESDPPRSPLRNLFMSAFLSESSLTHRFPVAISLHSCWFGQWRCRKLRRGWSYRHWADSSC